MRVTLADIDLGDGYRCDGYLYVEVLKHGTSPATWGPLKGEERQEPEFGFQRVEIEEAWNGEWRRSGKEMDETTLTMLTDSLLKVVHSPGFGRDIFDTLFDEYIVTYKHFHTEYFTEEEEECELSSNGQDVCRVPQTQTGMRIPSQVLPSVCE